MLIVKLRDAEVMAGFLILLFFLVLGPLAMLFGADSRTWDERGWWPGSPDGNRRDLDTGGAAPGGHAPERALPVAPGMTGRMPGLLRGGTASRPVPGRLSGPVALLGDRATAADEVEPAKIG